MSENEKIIELLIKAVSLYTEAQDAYDFHAFAHAMNFREQAKNTLLEALRSSTLLRENFSEIWNLVQLPGSGNVEFSFSDLEKAKQILNSH